MIFLQVLKLKIIEEMKKASGKKVADLVRKEWFFF